METITFDVSNNQADLDALNATFATQLAALNETAAQIAGFKITTSLVAEPPVGGTPAPQSESAPAE